MRNLNDVTSKLVSTNIIQILNISTNIIRGKGSAIKLQCMKRFGTVQHSAV